MVDVEVKEGVARIFLNRPEKANALDRALLDRLFEALDALQEEELHVAVLAGRGRAFCGGADVNELKGLDASSARSFITRIHDVCAAIRRLPVPVLAQMHGAVIGAGLEIAAACDLRVAREGTRFAMPEVRLGIPSVVEAALLPRLIGTGRAAWLVLSGEPIDAARALEWGLIEEVGDGAALLAALLQGEREALKKQKQLLQLWEEAPLSVSVRQSIDLFAASYSSGTPVKRLKGKPA